MKQCDFLIWKNLCTISIAARTSCLIVTLWKGQLLKEGRMAEKTGWLRPQMVNDTSKEFVLSNLSPLKNLCILFVIFIGPRSDHSLRPKQRPKHTSNDNTQADLDADAAPANKLCIALVNSCCTFCQVPKKKNATEKKFPRIKLVNSGDSLPHQTQCAFCPFCQVLVG